MKKELLIILLLIINALFTPFLMFIPTVTALPDHEPSSGTVNGSFVVDLLQIANHTRGTSYYGIHGNNTYVYAINGSTVVLNFTNYNYTFLDVNSRTFEYFDIWGNSTCVHVAEGNNLASNTFNGTALNNTYVDTFDAISVGSYNGTWFYAGGYFQLRAYEFNGSGINLLDALSTGSHIKIIVNDSYIFTTGGNGISAYTFDGTTLTHVTSRKDGSNNYGGLAFDGEYFYASCNYDGIRAYTFNGTNFTLCGHRDDLNETYYHHMYYKDGYIYATCHNQGFRVYSHNGATFTLHETIDSPQFIDVWGGNGFLHVIAGGEIRAYVNMGENYNVTRTVGTNYETNNFTHTTTNQHNNTILKIPVSSDVTGIVTVTNNTCGNTATLVDDYADLINNTYWYDPANDYVYIRTINLSVGYFINWTINCSYMTTFNIIFPTYREIGDILFADGMIENTTTGDSRSGYIAKTRILYQNFTQALSPMHKKNCTDGFFQYMVSSDQLIPGIYLIVLTYNDTTEGIVYQQGWVLYLSVDPPATTHIRATLSFNFYDGTTGIGLGNDLFKIFVSSNDSVFSSSERIYQNTYDTYTGATVYYKVMDYFDNQIYPSPFMGAEGPVGPYIELNVTKAKQSVDVPITFYDFAIKNLNNTIMHFSLEQNNIFHNITLFPGEGYHFYLTNGTYTINKSYYNAYNETFISYETDTITIDNDTFYSSTGYHAHLIYSFYNTNEGLGLPYETLKVYINGNRTTSNHYTTTINTSINLTVNDYYNNTLYTNTFFLNDSYVFLDFGLTFHSWLFCDKNDDYYMISLRREGATRWWERGIVPYGEREFLIPSGNYSMRIYDHLNNEVYNTSLVGGNITVVNSRVYVIHGTNLSLIIDGQSVIQGQLLELSNDIDYALMPDEVLWAVNPITVCSAFDKYGMLLGANVWKVCPPKVVVATTRNQTWMGNVTFIPLIPENDSSGDGTVSVLEDILWFNGDSNYVNISWADNGTEIQNTTYVPTKVYLTGGNITVNCSNNLSIMRETTYQQMKKFYWDIYNSTINEGHINGRGGYHRASIPVINSLATPLYNVNILAGFSNRTEPDGSTARVTDLSNGVITTDQSDDFKTTGSGIEFHIQGGLPANTTRNFLLEYYGLITSNYVYNDIQLEILPGFETRKPLGQYFYNYAEVGFHNHYNVGFKGSLHIRFNIDMDVDEHNIKVVDLDQNRMLESDEFIPSNTFVYISNDAIGTVTAGGVRNFGVYWLEDEILGDDPDEWTLNTQIISFMGIPVTPMLFVFIISMILSLIGVYVLWKKKRWDQKGIALILLGVIIFVVFQMLAIQGG